MSIELAMIAAHVPHICHEETAPDFQRPLIDSMKKIGEEMKGLGVEVIVIASSHWMSTFKHYVDGTPVHKGILTADECPDAIFNVPYNYPGDEQLARQLAQAGEESGLPVVAINEPTYVLDYGTVVPLRHLVPKEDIAVVPISVTWAADLNETFTWGQQIGKVLRQSEKRACFVTTGTLSHNLVRGVESQPSLAEQALNNQFVQYLLDGDYASAKQMLPQFARIAGVESGGRHIALLLGVMDGASYKAKYHAYAQSSASANYIMTFHPEK
jgi:3,4-dihydroxyphenylacetate 2,3-dioxygenase